MRKPKDSHMPAHPIRQNFAESRKSRINLVRWVVWLGKRTRILKNVWIPGDGEF